MDLDGKTLVRIYRQKKDGVIAYNTFLEGETIGFELIGALETVKHNLLQDMDRTQEDIPDKDAEKLRRLLDGDEKKRT